MTASCGMKINCEKSPSYHDFANRVPVNSKCLSTGASFVVRSRGSSRIATIIRMGRFAVVGLLRRAKSKKKRPLELIRATFGHIVVAHTGLEPVISALRGQRVNQLHQCAAEVSNYRCAAALLASYALIPVGAHLKLLCGRHSVAATALSTF